MKIVSICARGGSQGVLGKNIKPLYGKPLIAWTIEQALACHEIDAVYISTDSEAIADVAKAHGAIVPFIRPAHMATHDAPKVPVIKHLADWVNTNVGKVDIVVDLDPTSPLRDAEDIIACINMLDNQTDVVITGYEAEKNPYFNMVELESDGRARLAKMPPSEIFGRQSAPKVYAMNGSVYVWHYHTLDKGLWNGRSSMHIMPRERSIDIDTPIDFKLVELLMQEKLARAK